MTKVTLLTAAVVAVLHFAATLTDGANEPPGYADYQFAIMFSEANLNKSVTLENNIVSHGTVLQHHGPNFKDYLNSNPDPSALALSVEGHINVHASMYISNKNIYECQHGTSQECAQVVANIKLGNTSLGVLCTNNQNVSCDPVGKYRTFSGECNNVKSPTLGKANTAYDRALFPRYFRGFDFLRPELQHNSIGLPNARHISVTVSTPSGESEQSATLAVMQWAEFIANDLSFTAARKMIFKYEPIVCCDPSGRHLSPRHIHPFCAPIYVSESDSVYSKKYITCLNYVRSVPALNQKCTFGPMEQMNQASHFLDGSMIYGSSDTKAESLRKLVWGHLKVVTKNGYDFLPQSAAMYTSECEGNCYDSGDVRVNNYPQLAALHTLWVREHNRIANQLMKVHPNWTDETLYQEARRIVVAEIQHITYNEFLPVLLGPKKAAEIKSGSYDADESPAVLNEVATAALRFLTSLMQQQLSLPDKTLVEKKTLRLADTFFKPHIVEFEDNLDLIIRALTTQLSQKMDLGVVPDLTSKLYAASSADIGLDILSHDIQRGRDHGLPSYNEYRKYCGLPVAQNFEGLTNINPAVVQKLKGLYNDVQGVDLLVGALAENPAEGIVGETLSCLLSKQFKRTRVGDRYFYDNPQQPHPFTAQQLALVKNVSLAHIICKNSNFMRNVQPNVFLKPDVVNSIISCYKIRTPRVPS